MTSLTRIVVLQTSQIGVRVHYKASVTWTYYVNWYTHKVNWL